MLNDKKMFVLIQFGLCSIYGIQHQAHVKICTWLRKIFTLCVSTDSCKTRNYPSKRLRQRLIAYFLRFIEDKIFCILDALRSQTFRSKRLLRCDFCTFSISHLSRLSMLTISTPTIEQSDCCCIDFHNISFHMVVD